MTDSLSEIGKYAGVSKATVSRVLNGKPGVAESTRTAVLTALDVLGYERPSRLRGERVRLVGLVVPQLRNPVYPAFSEVIGGTLAQRGFAAMLCPTTIGGIPEPDFVDMMLERQVSGIIVVSGAHAHANADHRHYRLLKERGLPLVVVNGVVEGLGVPCVSVDDESSSDLAVRHLVSLGHQRIGLACGEDEHVVAVRKVAAFRAAVKRHLGDPEALVERSVYTFEGGYAASTELLEQGVTAIVCGSDLMALGAVRAVRRRGLDVPHDVSVVGYDDSMYMSLVDPPLTTIRQPIEAMGRTVVSMLLSQISGSPALGKEILFEPELVVRSSTGAVPPAGTPDAAAR